MMMPATTTPAAMLTTITPEGTVERTCQPEQKITVVGAGTVGAAIAYTLLVQGLGNEVALIDQNEALARGEMLDMLHATQFLRNQRVTCSTDYAAASLSRIIIITVGARSNDKQATTTQNTEIFRELIPQIVNEEDQAIIIVCSYPVDEMSYVTWKLSGLPPHRIIGVGTYLETSRFSRGIAERMNIHPSCCRAFVIGEHGSKSIPIWSSVNVAGIRLAEVNPDIGSPQDPEDWNAIFTEITDSADEVVCLKECASWGMALCVSRIVKAILHDTDECFTVSTHIKGCRHGIDKDVFLSLPVILGSDGIKKLIKQALNEREKEELQKSADRMFDLFKTLTLEKEETKATFECE